AWSLYELTSDEPKMAEHVAFLKGYPLFEGVPAEEWWFLLQHVTLDRHPSGTAIIHQGDAGDRFYVLVSGEVAILMRDVSGMWRHIATMSRGAYFGELALLYDVPRTANVVAHSDIEVLSIEREKFHQLAQGAPHLWVSINRAAVSRLPI
ncbi:MAG: cGMP-dependent protein kinase, isozyme 1-like, partial [Dehalococcoidia bacterium]|nr:cGMP-dependent protein kinase, isozyme 1-like [Dehalococcoidia bacterium]